MERYFLGISLPNELSDEIEAWRRRFRAPKMEPHITLIPPFNWGESEKLLIETIEKAVRHLQGFQIAGEGVGTFGNAVIFVNVNANTMLTSLQRTIVNALEAAGVPPERRRFHPHITLATRLVPDQFQEYQSILGAYNPKYEFECSRITLFRLVEEGNVKHWHVSRKIAFSGGS